MDILAFFLAAVAAGIAAGFAVTAISQPDPVRAEAGRGVRELEAYLHDAAASRG